MSTGKRLYDPHTGSEARASHAVLGTILLYTGAAIGFLLLVDRTTGLPFDAPRFWYVNRGLWLFFAVAFLGAGAALLWSRPKESDGEIGTSDVRFDSLVLYTRSGCHLCDDAKAVLEKHARFLPAIREVDIDSDPKLVEKFTTCVPVVEIDGKVRFRGRVNEVLLRRLIDAAPRRVRDDS